MTALRKVSPELQQATIVANFQRYFDVEFAVSPRQKAAVYGVRYNVYCEEQQYESADRFPNRQERDEFDEKSLHVLITHKSSGIHAGCVRLVSTGGRRETDILPLEKHCPDSVAPDFFRAQELQRENICEISRLAVDRRFRRRPGAPDPQSNDAQEGALTFSEDEVRTFPLIATAGFLAATAFFLFLGFVLLDREEKAACVPGKPCADPAVRRRMKITLWSATVLAVIFATFPRWQTLLF